LRSARFRAVLGTGKFTVYPSAVEVFCGNVHRVRNSIVSFLQPVYSVPEGNHSREDNMSFIVPTLASKLFAQKNLGACVIPQSIPDSGGVPGIGIVHLRGAVAPAPDYKSPHHPPTDLFPVFTLPVGMRPHTDRYLICWIASWAGMFNGQPTLCVVHANGLVEVKNPSGVILNVDSAIFFDGLTFIAEQ
jgi:hypothetical protein